VIFFCWLLACFFILFVNPLFYYDYNTLYLNEVAYLLMCMEKKEMIVISYHN
jgi:hypothetical protein